MKTNEKILDALESEKFVRWYEDVFVPQYVEDRIISKEAVLQKIAHLFKSDVQGE